MPTIRHPPFGDRNQIGDLKIFVNHSCHSRCLSWFIQETIRADKFSSDSIDQTIIASFSVIKVIRDLSLVEPFP